MGRRNVVADVVIVAFFGIGILKDLVCFLDLNKPFVEFPLMFDLTKRSVNVFDSGSNGIRMIFESEFSELIFDLIDRSLSRNT